MWSTTICLFAAAARLTSAAALPPWLDSAAGVILSTIPLNSFGDFHTLTLKEAAENPGLFEHTNIVEAATAVSTSFGLSELTAGLDTSTAASTDDASGDSGAAAPEVKQALAAATCASPQTRIEWNNYTDSDRRAFVDSIACLTQRPSAGAAYSPSASRYEDLVKTHQILTNSIHGNGIFFPWHRLFVHVFEQALRTECGFNRSMPWWDETLDTGAFNRSSLFTPEYFGSLPGPTEGRGTCITDGKFANLTCHIGPGLDNIDHCLSRAVDEKMTGQSSTAYINYCARQTVYGSFASCAETGPHAWAHNGIGSVMADVFSSSGDPSFFMHHLFVDHQYASWQEANTTRKEQVDGACSDGNNPCTALTLDTVLNMNGLADNGVVADVLDTQSETLCYRYDYYY